MREQPPLDLASRPLEAADLVACANALRGHLAYPESLVADLPVLWRDLLRDGSLHGTVVESRDGRRRRIVGFGAGVFVTDAWAAAALEATEPYLTARTLSATPSPILRPPAIARHNATGLNLLLLHYCEAPHLGPVAITALRYRLLQLGIETFSAYRIESVLQEFWDEIDPAFVVNGWGRVRSEYRRYFEGRGGPLPEFGQRPLLLGATREEVRARPCDLIAPLFIHTPPRIRFGLGEKDVLRCALAGRTDPEIARHLEIALPTVKARWRAIYDRVEDAAPELLPVQDAGDRTNRGHEKRRHLLEYLRRHPEELRPGIDDRRGPG